ncbi:MAG: T9SS type A sorting domain-containing protein, partial [Bacteroidota bacterium]
RMEIQDAVDFTISAPVEGWEVNPRDFRYNMTILGTVSIADKKDVSDIWVAAFVEDECRGLGQIIKVDQLDQYLTNLFVYADDPGEEVTFKIYDAKEGMLYDADSMVEFKINSHIGTLETPKVFSDHQLLGLPHQKMEVYPNPFTNQTTITYTLTEENTNVLLQIYDLNGGLVKTLVENKRQEIGIYHATFESSGLPAGMYLCKIVAGNRVETRKLLLKR